jgi:hypothetical protein
VTDIKDRLLSWCIDWNGAPMVDGEQPRIIPRVRDLRDAADEIFRLRIKIARLSNVLDSVDVSEADGRVYVGLTIPDAGFLAAYVRPGFKTFARDWKKLRDAALTSQERG